MQFLLAQKQTGSKGRKNIAYKPRSDMISNHDCSDPKTIAQMHEILRNYSRRVSDFLAKLLSPYAPSWQLDYASFRPFQEKGRKLRTRARNDLLHVDAFPTRPMHGSRILRFFTNINPVESRRWVTSKSCGELIEEFGGKAVPFPKTVGYTLKDRLSQKMAQVFRRAKIPIVLRSPYDAFMLQMHHFLKENKKFQRDAQKDFWEFPPFSCWAVYTDLVSHAALSGQYALEQTFIIPQNALLLPDQSPVSILERLSKRNMVNPIYSSQMFTNASR